MRTTHPPMRRGGRCLRSMNPPPDPLCPPGVAILFWDVRSRPFEGGFCNSLAPCLPFCSSCFHPVTKYHIIPDPASHLVNPTPLTCLITPSLVPHSIHLVLTPFSPAAHPLINPSLPLVLCQIVLCFRAKFSSVIRVYS